MCLLILKKNNPIPVEYLRRGFKRNPDMAGFAYINNGKIVIKKGFSTFEDFYKAFEPFNYNIYGQKIIIHFRATSGSQITKTNSHPFYFDDKNYCFAHNGYIQIRTEKHKSDTRQFRDDILNKLIKLYKFDDYLFQSIITRFVGDKNKLVLMNSTGETRIINEKEGIWENGNWYSNSDYRFFCNYKRAWRRFKNSIRFPWSK